jgi:hypothetical protein
MKSIAVLITCFLFLTACKKNKTVFVEGFLLEDCNTPAANISLIAIQNNYNHALFSKDVWEEFDTNPGGYFRFETKKNVTLKLNLKSQMTTLVNDIEIGNTNINLGKIYSKPFLTKHVISLDVVNPYTENDTLILIYKNNTNNANNNLFKYYPGPFQNGILDTFENITFKGFPRQYSFVEPINFQISYNFRVRSLPNLNKTVQSSLNFSCSNAYNHTTLVID